MAITPTQDTYTEFDRAYDYFNAALFAGKLPQCVITLQRRRKAYGYFAGNTWTDARGQIITDEIALNPDRFAERSTAESPIQFASLQINEQATRGEELSRRPHHRPYG